CARWDYYGSSPFDYW
nr:immunoglobulin heavy chain junction region [Mus musculus]MBK4189922.1 immunoglobulin heavy chain junction region [Mus musculus]MBK4189923.1 immunoglobulin heavy chain junction region [Mus musculus]